MNSDQIRSAIGGRIRTASASILLVILLLYVIMGGFHLPRGSSVYREIENAAHIPLFALVALGALHLLRAGPFGPLRRFPWDYLGALVSASGLGALTELRQFYSPTRDADFNDLGRDIIGAVVLLGVHLTTGRERLGRGSPGVRLGVQTLCALLLLAALAPLILTWAASIDRKGRFPVI
ncbi:MAG: VanZ family protein, partial [Candidatus Krumholzibacteria bacterium]|nr:VanZ family protein [Candidatus Krumholzibacteria bacterium]